MEEFPFTEREWAFVNAVASSILNARNAEDEERLAAHHKLILDLLANLRSRYGDHPVLLETIADYTENNTERTVLYRRAIEIALANGLPTLSIQLSFAPVLVELGEPTAALEALRACGGEAANGNEEERERWVYTLWEIASTPNDESCVPLYRHALEIAVAYGAPTLSLRLGLARALLDIGKFDDAIEQLRMCEHEVPSGDEWKQTAWADMLKEATDFT